MTLVSHWQALMSEAVLYRYAGNLLVAIDKQIQAIAVAKQVPTLAEQVVIDLNYLADLYLSQGMLTEAEAAIREALQRERELPRPGPTAFAANLMILAKVLHQQGNCHEAVRLGKQAFAIYKTFIDSRSDYYRSLKRQLAQFRIPPAASGSQRGEVA